MADRLFILDYGGGNTRSLTNSIKRLGYEFEWVKEPKDLANAEVRGRDTASTTRLTDSLLETYIPWRWQLWSSCKELTQLRFV